MKEPQSQTIRRLASMSDEELDLLGYALLEERRADPVLDAKCRRVAAMLDGQTASTGVEHLQSVVEVLKDARGEVATYGYQRVHGRRVRQNWAAKLLERIDAALNSVGQGG